MAAGKDLCPIFSSSTFTLPPSIPEAHRTMAKGSAAVHKGLLESGEAYLSGLKRGLHAQMSRKDEGRTIRDAHVPYPALYPPILYSSLAHQIVDDYGIMEGVCLDIGSGVGLLGIELARRTSLEVCLIDINRTVLDEAMANAKHFGVYREVKGLRTDIHHLPFVDETIDLIVSRGSFIFWKDLTRALKEIHRALAPSGIAFIGGGLHRYLPKGERKILKERITAHFKSPRGKNVLPPAKWPVTKCLAEAKVKTFRIIHDDPGTWIEIRKCKR
jgi:SAM-dependent methyltransferase